MTGTLFSFESGDDSVGVVLGSDESFFPPDPLRDSRLSLPPLDFFLKDIFDFGAASFRNESARRSLSRACVNGKTRGCV